MIKHIVEVEIIICKIVDFLLKKSIMKEQTYLSLTNGRH